MNNDEQDQIRARQRARALATGALLVALVVLFYLITLAKIGGN
ncbi:hypothetical protein [Rhizorhapis sp. SPR117]